MKKLISSVLVLCVAFTIFAGCASKEKSPNQGSSTTSVKQEATTVQPAKPVTLMVTSWVPEQKPAMEKIAQAFSKENPGVTIEFNIVPGDQYSNITKTKLLANDAPDVFFHFSGSVADLAKNNLVGELTGQPFYEKLLPAFKKLDSEGKIYHLPVDYSASGVFYNPEIFKKLNLQAPKTYAEFLDICEKIKASGVEPIALGAKDAWTVNNQIIPMFASLTKTKKPDINLEIYEGKAKYTDPEFKLPYTAFDSLVKKEYLNKGLLGITFQQSVTSVIEGKTAMIITGSFVVGTADGINKDFSFGYFPFPSDEGDPAVVLNVDKAMVYDAKGKNTEVSKKFINFYAKPDMISLHCEALNMAPCIKDVTPKIKPAVLDVVSAANKFKAFNSAIFSPAGRTRQTLGNITDSILAGQGIPEKAFEQMQEALQEELKTSDKIVKPVPEAQ